VRHGNLCCRLQAHLFAPSASRGWDEKQRLGKDGTNLLQPSRNLFQFPPAPATHGICKATQHLRKPAAPAQDGT
jgi:hypothetical protein